MSTTVTKFPLKRLWKKFLMLELCMQLQAMRDMHSCCMFLRT